MINLLKKIKYYLISNNLLVYIKNLIIFFFTLKFLNKNLHKPSALGNFEVNLDWKNLQEIQLINKINSDVHYLQSLRNFLKGNTIFFIYKPKSNLLLKFLNLTLGAKILIFSKKKNNEESKSISFLNNEVKFFNKLNTYKKYHKVLILDGNLDNISDYKSSLQKFDIILSNKKINHYLEKKIFNYIFDQFGKINSVNSYSVKKYFLYSKENLLNENNDLKIGGIGLLKSLDLYPFDICFESVMDFVDEFLIGIDQTSFNKDYEILLNNYLKQSKYKKKIKIIFFDFKTKTTDNIHAHGRWVADGYNYLSTKSRSEYLLCMCADELFDAINKDKIDLYKENFDHYNLNFLHLVKNFNFIRDPQFTAYNDFMRIFKRKCYVSTDDGMGFRKNNFYRPNEQKIDINIFHLGYMLDNKKKVKEHFSPGGLFYKQATIKQFYKNMHPIPINNKDKLNLIKRLNQFKYLDGYHKLKNYIYE